MNNAPGKLLQFQLDFIKEVTIRPPHQHAGPEGFLLPEIVPLVGQF
jgi:hypothetical protein